MTTSCVDLHAVQRIMSAYFRTAPLAHALFRSVEALALSGHSLARPVLDLGCGTGEFVSLALASPVDVGLDIDDARLAVAATTNKYLRMVHGDACNMPLPDSTFRTVLCVSALEHFPDPQAVVRETSRVLLPGGVFLGTVTLTDLHEHLFYPWLLRRIGMIHLARWYDATQDRCFRHRTMLSKEAWENLFGRYGLHVLLTKRILSPSLTRLWDLLLPMALPSWLLCGRRRRLVWRPAWLARRLAAWLEPYAAVTGEQGSVLLFVAKKSAANAAAADLQGAASTIGVAGTV